jgi:hypothetical protein
LIELMSGSPHLKRYLKDENQETYKLYVFPSDTDNVLVVAAGCSLMREHPRIAVRFGGINK